MKRFSNVLVVAGGEVNAINEIAFNRAVDLARRNSARLTLLDVVREPPTFGELVPPDILETIRRVRRQSLARLEEAVRSAGLEVESELVAGRPVLEIIERVKARKVDLVMTDGGSEDAIDHTTMYLMRKCPCAIWVVREPAVKPYRKVLAAVDPQPPGEGRNALNRRIMELAIAMAQIEESELHVVHVWEAYGLPSGSSAAVWKHWEVTAQTEVQAAVERFLAPYHLDPPPRIHLVAGRPSAAIVKLAGDEQVDLLVMGTVCRTGIRGLFIGNTAEEVLGRVGCSLLTVKPDDFVSPV